MEMERFILTLFYKTQMIIDGMNCTKIMMYNRDKQSACSYSSPAVSYSIVKLTDLYIGWSKEMTLQQTYLLIVQYIVPFDLLCVMLKWLKDKPTVLYS